MASCAFPFSAGFTDLDPGRKTEKHVALLPFNRRLRQRMEPSYFCTIPLLIQSPKPVPFADLVVKNGSKRRLASSGLIPEPLSRMDTRTPCLLPLPFELSITRTFN